MPLTLYDHQLQGVEACRSHPRYLFEWDMGTGKTLMTLAAIDDAYRRGIDWATLVVAPSSVLYSAWMNDAKHFPDLKTKVCWHNDPSLRRRMIRDAKAQIYITTPDCFRIDAETYRECTGIDRVVFDEAGKLRNHGSKIAAASCEFSKGVKGFWMLSGNPAPNGQWEYWSLVRCIDPAIFDTSFYRFRSRYFAGHKEQIGWSAKGPIDALMKMAGNPLAHSRRPLRWPDLRDAIMGFAPLFGIDDGDEIQTAFMHQINSKAALSMTSEVARRWLKPVGDTNFLINDLGMRIVNLFKPGSVQPHCGYVNAKAGQIIEWIGRMISDFGNKELMFDKYEVEKGFRPIELWQPEFMAKLSPVCWVLAKEDCIDLPGETDMIRAIELSPAERKAYSDFKHRLQTEHPDTGNVTSVSLDALTIKLRQAASGFVYDEMGEPVVFGESTLDDLIELLDELGNAKLVVWSTLKFNVKRICERLDKEKIGFTYIDGSITKPEERGKRIDSFQDLDSDVRVMVANPASLSHGVTLTAASHDYWFDLSWFPDQHSQARARIYRIGQREKVLHHYALPIDTVSEKIYQVLTGKMEAEEAFKSLLMQERELTIAGKDEEPW